MEIKLKNIQHPLNNVWELLKKEPDVKIKQIMRTDVVITTNKKFKL